MAKITKKSKIEEEQIEFNQNQGEDSIVNEQELLENQIAISKDKYTRLFAEFDNYKKRTAKERLELITSAGKEVIVSMIPVLDDFERGLNSVENEDDKAGLFLVLNKLKNNLEQKGLKVMKTSINDDFDVDLHEAITTIPAQDENMKGKIVDIIEKGYLLGDKVIRYAKVVIGE